MHHCVVFVYYSIIKYLTFLCSFVLHYCVWSLFFFPLVLIFCIGAWCGVQRRIIIILLPLYSLHHVLSLHKRSSCHSYVVHHYLLFPQCCFVAQVHYGVLFVTFCYASPTRHLFIPQFCFIAQVCYGVLFTICCCILPSSSLATWDSNSSCYSTTSIKHLCIVFLCCASPQPWVFILIYLLQCPFIMHHHGGLVFLKCCSIFVSAPWCVFHDLLLCITFVFICCLKLQHFIPLSFHCALLFMGKDLLIMFLLLCITMVLGLCFDLAYYGVFLLCIGMVLLCFCKCVVVFFS